MIDLASTSRRCATSISMSAERDLLDHHVLLFDARRFRSTSARRDRAPTYTCEYSSDEAGRVEELAELHEPLRACSRSLPAARGAAVASGSSPSTSRLPAGTSSSSRSAAARYWRTSTRRLPVARHGHDDHRARMAHDDAARHFAVGRLRSRARRSRGTRGRRRRRARDAEPAHVRPLMRDPVTRPWRPAARRRGTAARGPRPGTCSPR